MRRELALVVFAVAFVCGTARAAGTPRLVLSWDALPDAQGYEIQIAEDPAFARIVVSDAVAIPRYEWAALPDAPRYWRVRCQFSWGRRGPWSPVRTLIAVRPAAPRTPAEGARLTWTGSESAVDLAFDSNAALQQHVVELAADPEFTDIVATAETRTDTARVPLLRTGTLHWRVRSTDILGRPVAPSAPASLQVSTGVARGLSPSSGLVLGISGTPVALRWQPAGAGVRHIIDVETDAGVETLAAETTPATWVATRPGAVTWRVRTLGPDGAPGPAASASFTFAPPPPIPVASTVTTGLAELAVLLNTTLPPSLPSPPPAQTVAAEPAAPVSAGGGAAIVFDGGALSPAAFATVSRGVSDGVFGRLRAGYRERRDSLNVSGAPKSWNAVARITSLSFEVSGSRESGGTSRGYAGGGLALHVATIRVGPWEETHLVPALAAHAGVDFRVLGARSFVEIHATTGRVTSRIADLDVGGVAFAAGLRFGR